MHGVHHAEAAERNARVGDQALDVLTETLAGAASVERILLKAAAGAGKSYLLRRLVAETAGTPNCQRSALVAFTNKQTHGLAGPLGDQLGADQVCLLVAKDRWGEVPDDVHSRVTVTTSTAAIPAGALVVISTCHRLRPEYIRQLNKLGPAHNGETPYDVLFVDEAWQIPNHLFRQVNKFAPITTGVGDVGQLPPLEAGTNPWRGARTYNPFRAWPNEYEDDENTWTAELPAIWRPAAGQLGLWRAFYPEWNSLDCVAAPGDRNIEIGTGLSGAAGAVWQQVATGIPTLLEVDGLPEPEAADIDLPLMHVVEKLIGELFDAGFVLVERDFDGSGNPTSTETRTAPGGGGEDPLVTILATRNQTVDDAADAIDRLRAEHQLADQDLVCSTVDSYQGQTNGITVALHPLTGATDLNEFNSAFGRLAVVCTRAKHGLLMVARPGLDRLLTEAPARPGTPFGEPGNRQLPRQTHQRILATFARGKIIAVNGTL